MNLHRTPLTAADQIAYTAINAEIAQQIREYHPSGLPIAFSPNTPVTPIVEVALTSWWHHQGWSLSVHRGGLADTILLQAIKPTT